MPRRAIRDVPNALGQTTTHVLVEHANTFDIGFERAEVDP